MLYICSLLCCKLLSACAARVVTGANDTDVVDLTLQQSYDLARYFACQVMNCVAAYACFHPYNESHLSMVATLGKSCVYMLDPTRASFWVSCYHPT